MIVLTVVTAPTPVRVGLRPSKGRSAGQGLPNLYFGTELPRGSVLGSSKDRSGMGEDVSAFRRQEARRAAVSDSVYSLDRMGEATIKMRVPVGSPIILRAHDKTLSHSVRYAPARKPAFATSSRPSLNAWSCRNMQCHANLYTRKAA
jgi:hypothetical protein